YDSAAKDGVPGPLTPADGPITPTLESTKRSRSNGTSGDPLGTHHQEDHHANAALLRHWFRVGSRGYSDCPTEKGQRQGRYDRQGSAGRQVGDAGGQGDQRGQGTGPGVHARRQVLPGITRWKRPAARRNIRTGWQQPDAEVDWGSGRAG